jgi:hypothetical protein
MARPFTVSEKTRLGNGDADDADDDDDSKRHFCVYVFVCVYSANLIHTGTCVGQTGTDRDGRAADAAERDGRRRRRKDLRRERQLPSTRQSRWVATSHDSTRRARDRRETRTVVTDGRTGGARIRFARENLDASSRGARRARTTRAARRGDD